MIQRVVTVQLAQGYRDPRSLAAIAAETRRVLADAAGVLHVDVATAADARTRREWDLCILVRFATLAAVEAYRDDPIHRAYADVFLKPMRKSIRVWHFALHDAPDRGAAMAEAWLDGVLATLPRARVAVFGDFALDAYWMLAEGHGETSLETGLPVQRVGEQRYQAGGAGNVVANLLALGVAEVHAVGLLGTDPFGAELRRGLQALGACCRQLLVAADPWQTLVFAKPHRGATEQSRLDFGSTNRLGEQDTVRLRAALPA